MSTTSTVAKADARDMFSLAGKTALVTGGSRGLGLQIAEALGDQGAKLIISSRKAGDLQAAREHLVARGIEVEFIVADNQIDDDVERLAKESVSRLGRLDILINNAGATWGAPMEDYPTEAWDKVMNLNIRSIFLLSKHVGKLSMIPNKHGRILNIASIAGLRGGQGIIAYNTSKAAVINFTRSLASEWAKYGITVNALAPGMFDTKMTRAVLARAASARTTRIGDGEDLKGATLLFTSNAGKHISGQTLAIDGGFSA